MSMQALFPKHTKASNVSTVSFIDFTFKCMGNSEMGTLTLTNSRRGGRSNKQTALLVF